MLLVIAALATVVGPLLVVLVTAVLARFGTVNRLRQLERLAEVAQKLPEQSRARRRLLARADVEAKAQILRLDRRPWYRIVAVWVFVLVVIMVAIRQWALRNFDTPFIASGLASQVEDVREAGKVGTAAAVVIVALSRAIGFVFFGSLAVVATRSWMKLEPMLTRTLNRFQSNHPTVRAADRWAAKWLPIAAYCAGVILPTSYIVWALFTG